MRKPIATSGDKNMVICDDRSIWGLIYKWDEGIKDDCYEWTRLPDIPQEDKEKS